MGLRRKVVDLRFPHLSGGPSSAQIWALAYLGVGDVALSVKGNVEVDAHDDLLALDVDIGD